MSDISSPNSHTFTRSEINLAKDIFEKSIKRYFGEIWQIKSDGEYIGKSWDCKSVIAFDPGVWRLCQAAIHAGATRAAGRIETKEAGTVLRFIIFYNKKKQEILE